MTSPTDQPHRLRRVRDLHNTYSAVDSDLPAPVRDVATASPIALQRPEPPNSEAVRTASREQSAYSEAFVEQLKTTARDVEPIITDPQPAIQAQVGSWCELHGYDLSSETTPTILARQVVFALLLKSSLYEWYHRHGNLPEFSGDAREDFQLAREETGDSAFTTYVLDEIRWRGTRLDTAAVTSARDRLLTSTQPATDIGRLYESLIPGDRRKVLGQFRTPQDVGRAMQKWVTSGGDTVLDPGMGAGELSTPFHPDWKLSTDPGRVDGVDRSPLSLLMGRTALTLAGQSNELRAADFLNLDPEDLRGDIDGIVCNPPYTSGDTLSAEYKTHINAEMEQTTGFDISARSALYAYFLYHSRSFLSSGDRAAFLTPHSFLANDYGESLKQFLLDEFSIKAFVQFDPTDTSIFDDAQITALITFAEATNEAKADSVTRFIRVNESIESAVIHDAVEEGTQGSTEWGYINCVPQGELSPTRNWQALFRPCTIDTTDFTPLREFVSVHRGKSTGNVDFFCLSQDDVDRYEIADQHLSRLIRRPGLVDGYDFHDEDWETLRETGEEAWLLDPDELLTVPESMDTFHKQATEDFGSLREGAGTRTMEVTQYLREGVAEYDLLGTETLETRPYWYRPRRQDPPRILVQDGSRDEFRFVLNETDARNINGFRGLYDITVDEDGLKAILAFLNSGVGQRVIRRQTKTKQDGYATLGVDDIKSLPVIDPNTLADGIVAALADAFDDLRDTARHGGDCGSVTAHIDTILQRSL